MSEVKSDQKTRRAYIDKTARAELELEVKMCPISGISCADCGYKTQLDMYDCFVNELILVLREVAKSG